MHHVDIYIMFNRRHKVFEQGADVFKSEVAIVLIFVSPMDKVSDGESESEK